MARQELVKSSWVNCVWCGQLPLFSGVPEFSLAVGTQGAFCVILSLTLCLKRDHAVGEPNDRKLDHVVSVLFDLRFGLENFEKFPLILC